MGWKGIWQELRKATDLDGCEGSRSIGSVISPVRIALEACSQDLRAEGWIWLSSTWEEEVGRGRVGGGNIERSGRPAGT